ncbi:MAG: hypothetical protein EP343_12890 [Deltaproteobacteria bacterium]|nr:MAG: hypothetical protein EP343_12890 [Deltaproteobacteria bacterium]
MNWKEMLSWKSRSEEPESSGVQEEPSIDTQETLQNEANPFASLLAALPAQETSPQPKPSATTEGSQGSTSSQGFASEVHPTLSQLSDWFAAEAEEPARSQPSRPLETFAQVSPFGSLHPKQDPSPGGLNIAVEDGLQLDDIVGIFDAIANEPSPSSEEKDNEAPNP